MSLCLQVAAFSLLSWSGLELSTHQPRNKRFLVPVLGIFFIDSGRVTQEEFDTNATVMESPIGGLVTSARKRLSLDTFPETGSIDPFLLDTHEQVQS